MAVNQTPGGKGAGRIFTLIHSMRQVENSSVKTKVMTP